MKHSSLSLNNFIVIFLNTFTFIVGILSFFLKGYLYAALCLLVLSLLNIYQFFIVRGEDETPPVVEEDNDMKWEYLKQIKDLTDDNQGKSAEIEQLRTDLENLKAKEAQYASDLYHFPLCSTTPIPLAEIIERLVADFEKKLSSKKISCTYTSTYDGSNIYISVSAINTIIKDLFDNVYKFTPENGSTNLNLANTQDGILFIIKNSSPALAPAELEHIFELNYQASNRLAGTGLGLAQVSAIVRDYGGNVYAKSNHDTGFTIYLELPSHMTGFHKTNTSGEEVETHEE